MTYKTSTFKHQPPFSLKHVACSIFSTQNKKKYDRSGSVLWSQGVTLTSRSRVRALEIGKGDRSRDFLEMRSQRDMRVKKGQTFPTRSRLLLSKQDGAELRLFEVLGLRLLPWLGTSKCRGYPSLKSCIFQVPQIPIGSAYIFGEVNAHNQTCRLTPKTSIRSLSMTPHWPLKHCKNRMFQHVSLRAQMGTWVGLKLSGVVDPSSLYRITVRSSCAEKLASVLSPDCHFFEIGQLSMAISLTISSSKEVSYFLW